MAIVGESLKEYYQKKGVLPVDARQYLASEGFSVSDEWGYPYSIANTTDQFSIASLGSDHQIGGVGDATDIIVRWRQGTENLTIISADIHP
jgi:type II secretion system (T2SS) protein G